jgi:heme/copper-type cytochrome/quinol oxidase subunit 3
VWPFRVIELISPTDLPLLNTLILLSSGVTITALHFYLLLGVKLIFYKWLTIMLGVYFLGVQLFEYFNCCFIFTSSTYGSRFFILTGFHGLHVILGVLFLSVILATININRHTPLQHVGVELRIWYWHFVDVVWLVLFLLVYCWGP